MAATDYTAVVQQLYVSYFGRPADFYGLAAFSAQLAAMNAPTDLASIDAAVQLAAQSGVATPLSNLVNGFSGSNESSSLYGTGTSTIDISKFVNVIYNNLLNRDADTPGLAYWVNAITSGALTKADAALAIADAANSNTSGTAQGAIDQTVVGKKIAVATEFTATLDSAAKINAYSGDAATAAGRGLIASVNASTDPVAFQSVVTATQNSLIVVPVVTTTLTGGVDTFLGTAANDVVNVTLGTVGTNGPTLTAFDSINGGAGNNTLNIVNAQTSGVGTAIDTTAISGLSVTNMQTVNVQGTSTVVVDASGFTGTTALNILSSTGTDTITAAATTAVNVADSAGTVIVHGGSAVNVSTNGAITSTGGTTLVGTITSATSLAGQQADVAAQTAAVAAKAAQDLVVSGQNTMIAAISGETTGAQATTAAAYTAERGYTAAAVAAGAITAAQKTAIDAAFLANLGSNDATPTGSPGNLANAIAGAATVYNAIHATALTTQTADNTAVNAANLTVLGDVAAGNFAVNDTSATLISATVTGNYAGTTTINDGVTSSGTLTTVVLNNAGAATLSGTALVNVSVANGAQSVTINNSTATHALALALNGDVAGTYTDATAKTVNVTTAGVKTSGVTVSAAAATSLTFADAVGFSGTITAGAVTSEKITGAGSFKAVSTGLAAAAVIDATGATGVVTTTLGAGQTFKGGSTSVITISADAAKAITAGAGTSDELVLNGSAATFIGGATTTIANATGFEILGVSTLSTGTYDLSTFTGFKGIDVQNSAGGALSFINIAAGTTFAVDSSLTAGHGVTYALANATGTTDTVAVALGTASTTGIDATAGVTTTGIETVNITSNGDGKTTNSIHLIDATATKVVLTGAEGVDLTGSTLGSVATIDATGIAAKQNVTIDGSASATTGATVTATDANLTFTGAAIATKSDVITAGNGIDTIVELNGNNTITLGNGVDSVTVGSGNNTIKVGNGIGDIVTVTGAGTNTITVGNGGSTITVAGGLNTINLGTSAADVVSVTAAGTNGNVYTTVNGFIKGDALTLTGLTGFDAANKVVLAPTAVFQDYLNGAVHAEAANHATWFQFGGNTYVVEAVAGSNMASFTNNTDIVVQLTGTVDLSGTHAAFAAHTITLA